MQKIKRHRVKILNLTRSTKKLLFKSKKTMENQSKETNCNIEHIQKIKSKNEIRIRET